MAQFLYLLYPEGTDMAAMPAPDKQALFARFVTWTESLKSQGVLRGVESLMDDGGRTVRRSGELVTVDGPYAEMKELVSGLYVVEQPDMAAACRLAGDCPLLKLGGRVEVREIFPFPVRP